MYIYIYIFMKSSIIRDASKNTKNVGFPFLDQYYDVFLISDIQQENGFASFPCCDSWSEKSSKMLQKCPETFASQGCYVMTINTVGKRIQDILRTSELCCDRMNPKYTYVYD